jgi:hypothetical protein
MTGAIIGTTSTFTNAGSGVGVEITNSSTGDGLKINHSSGRALNIASSGSGFGIIINNSTASTSAPFTIQKQGSNVITLSDNGAANFAGQLTLGSTITNGTNTFTLPSATGTLALTSAIPANPVGGTGTTNYLPKFTGASTIGNSLVFDNGTNVGIGTASPSNKLTISNNGNAAVAFRINDTNANASFLSFNVSNTDSAIIAGGTSAIPFDIYTGGVVRLSIASTGAATFSSSVTANYYDGEIFRVFTSSTLRGGIGTGSWAFGDGTNDMALYSQTAVKIGAGGSQKMVITSGGNVGIGTTSPSATLHTEVNSATWTAKIINTNTSTNNAGLLIKAGVNSGNEILLAQKANGTSVFLVDASGNVGIGTTSPNGKLNISNGGAEGIEFWTLSATATNLMQSYNRATSAWNSLEYKALDHIFYGSGTERMRITTTTPSNMTCVLINKTSADGSYPLQVAGIAGGYVASATGVGDANYYSTSNTIGYHFYADRGSGSVFNVATNGDVKNSNNSYGAISDISLKENIIDTTSKLADLLKVKIRNYNLIGDDKKQIGVIAQELETIFPSMIDTDSITGLKSVKYSVFVPMLIKGMQELKAELDTLKNK